MNVVFDLGGVLLHWKPGEIVARLFPEPDERSRVRDALYGHPDWVGFDRGELSSEEIVERGVERTGISEERIERFMLQLRESLTPIDESVRLAQATHDAGNRLYVLSNMPIYAIDYLEQKVPFWGLFDGIVFSSRVRMVKPERWIYEHLLATYNLAPGDTVFIDDTEVNLTAAAKHGIKTIRFDTPFQCESELRSMGCI
ncbi:MAG: HAD family phosphatase [Spirochaetaceae bacterium]|nr:HAD family phosphatase [Spirochaetaceae bacterium]